MLHLRWLVKFLKIFVSLEEIDLANHRENLLDLDNFLTVKINLFFPLHHLTLSINSIYSGQRYFDVTLWSHPSI